MKLVIALALALTATASFAKTLSEYDASLSYIVSWPTVIFSNVSVPVKNVCVEGSNLKTIAPATYCSQSAVVEVCTTLNHSEECRAVRAGETPVQKPGTRLVYGCVAHASANFATPVAHEVQVCTKWEKVQTGSHNNTVNVCVEFGTETKDYPLSYDVSVTAMDNNNHARVEVDNQNFTIPACK